MDMALAHIAEQRITGQSGSLDAAQWRYWYKVVVLLRKSARGSGMHEAYRVIPGRGSKLIGGAQSCELSGAEVETSILDKLPRCCVLR